MVNLEIGGGGGGGGGGVLVTCIYITDHLQKGTSN